MKLLAIFAVLLVASVNVEAKSLAEAMIALRAVLRLHSWVAAWDVRRNSDNAVCQYSNRLNQPDVLPQAQTDIEADTFYQFLQLTMESNGVPWQDFIDEELMPALGRHALVSSCTTLSSGGVLALRNQLNDYFDEGLVTRAVNSLKAESSDFLQLHETLRDNQDQIDRIFCFDSVQRVYNTKKAEGVDFDFVFKVLEIIFGWDINVQC